MGRVSWDRYFMNIAKQVASRATCDRLKVGCIIVRGRRILTTGYNGSVQGLDHCDEQGHDMVDGHCVRTIHAEVNAVIQAARDGVSIWKAEVYCIYLPCWECFKVLANAGIAAILYESVYPPMIENGMENKVRKAARTLQIRLLGVET